MHGVETILNVLGSVTLLLWGVRMVRTGLTRAFGTALRRAIGACSRNRFAAFAGGLAVTGLLQSSTATALLLSSFAARGLISLSIALAIMLGLMLLSLRLLSLATEPLRTAPAFAAVLGGLQDEYVIAAIIATLATWFVHSSLSTILLIMSFAASGIIG